MPAADIVSALNRMLESEEQRERYKMSHSLAMVQFQQQKRMQDIQLAGQQLQFLQEANKQAMISQSTQFLTDTGLAGMDLEDEDSYEEMKDLLTDDIDIEAGVNVGGYGVDPITASRMLSAVHAAQKGSPQAVLNIADEVWRSTQKKTQTPKEKSLIKAFSTMGYFDDKEAADKKLRTINKTMQNISNITQEMYEFGTGDFDITRDIGMYEPSATPAAPPSAMTKLGNRLSMLSKVKSSDANDTASELQVAVEKLDELNSEIELLESLSAEELRTNKKLLTDDQRTILVDKDESVKLLSDDIASLTEDYSKKKSQLASIAAVDVKRKVHGWDSPEGVFGEHYREKFPTIESLTELFRDVDPEVLGMVTEGQPGDILSETTIGQIPQYLVTAPKDVEKGKISDLPGWKQLDLLALGKMIQERRTIQEFTLGEKEKEKEYYKLFPEMRGQ